MVVPVFSDIDVVDVSGLVIASDVLFACPALSFPVFDPVLQSSRDTAQGWLQPSISGSQTVPTPHSNSYFMKFPDPVSTHL